LFFLDLVVIGILEFIEAHSLKGHSLKTLIEELGALLKEKKLHFILLHSSFFFMIFLIINYEISSFLITTALLVKALDIAFKLYLIKRIDENGHFSIINILGVPDIAISKSLKYSGIVIYPLLFALGAS